MAKFATSLSAFLFALAALPSLSVPAAAQDIGVCEGDDGLIRWNEDQAKKQMPLTTSGDWQEAARILQLYLDQLNKEPGFRRNLYLDLNQATRDTSDKKMRSLRLQKADHIAQDFAQNNSWVNCGSDKRIEISRESRSFQDWGRFVCVHAQDEADFKDGMEEGKTEKSAKLKTDPRQGVIITAETNCKTWQCNEDAQIQVCTLQAPHTGCVIYPLFPGAKEVTGKNAADFRFKSVRERIEAQDLIEQFVKTHLVGTGCVYPPTRPGQTLSPDALGEPTPIRAGKSASTRDGVENKSPENATEDAAAKTDAHAALPH